MTLPKEEPTPAAEDGLSIERWSATSGSERGSRAAIVLHGAAGIDGAPTPTATARSTP